MSREGRSLSAIIVFYSEDWIHPTEKRVCVAVLAAQQRSAHYRFQKRWLDPRAVAVLYDKRMNYRGHRDENYYNLQIWTRIVPRAVAGARAVGCGSAGGSLCGRVEAPRLPSRITFWCTPMAAAMTSTFEMTLEDARALRERRAGSAEVHSHTVLI